MAGVLQHLRSSTLNKRPNPASMVDGQLAINYASGSPGAFFKDSNGNLVKVGPVHVGATAPNVSPASGGTAGNSLGEQWLDTSGGTYVFKIWDGAAWRSEAGEFVNTTGDTMTGALGIIAGSASTPGLFFSGDANSGLYSPGADQVAISTGGTGRITIDGSGNVNIDSNTLYVDATNNRVGIGTTSPARTLHVAGSAVFVDTVDTTVWAQLSTGVGGIGTNNNYPFAFAINGTERARIDSSGRLLVGTSTARLYTSLGYARFQVEGTAFADSSIGLTNNQATVDGSYLVFNKTRGTSVGSVTSVQSGDLLGSIWFQGSDGTSQVRGAVIEAAVDATPGASDMPGRLVFSVTADGASSPTEAMRIKNSRILNFANTPTYADNTAAKAGGLVDGDVYRKSDGTLMIVYT
jgi:hypothetical protein